MYEKQIRKIAIVGGGTAGWMAAAALSNRYKDYALEIELIESEAIGTVGVGEATIPGIRSLHFELGISETEFIRATNASFKLGIQFDGWRQPNHRFFHPFADYGVEVAEQKFYLAWLYAKQNGYQADLSEFCLSIALAESNRFSQPDVKTDNKLALYNYAYHFDASLYAQFLRAYAEERGVRRIEGKIVDVALKANDGSIDILHLEDGRQVKADMYIDCSGFIGLLIEKALKTGFEDWSHWLPCNSAVVGQTEIVEAMTPYTKSMAEQAGWRWRIPLSHRVGNGYVYCNEFISDDEAENTLQSQVEGPLITAPRLLRFKTGMRKLFWNKNCVALGLASGFLEPLESTSISLIQTGIEKLMQFMPDLIVHKKNQRRANELNRMEYERIRDFIVLHYYLNQRPEEEFWQSLRSMEIPDTLREKIQQFKQHGKLLNFEQESFTDPSWLTMYNGFDLHASKEAIPQDVQRFNIEQLKTLMEKMRLAIQEAIKHAPAHADFLKQVYDSDAG